MDGYGVNITTPRGRSRYRTDGNSEWDLRTAEEIAHSLAADHQTNSVSFGNGEHEFRWSSEDDQRWAEWYVDVEINGRRWWYRPMADLHSYSDADELAEIAAVLADDVTLIWVGRSDGSQEFESEVGN